MKSSLSSIILLLLGWLLTSSASLSAKDYYIYYLGGQSNMDGYGYNKDLPESLQAPMKDVMIYHGNPAKDDAEKADGRGKWTTLRPGHGVGFSTDGETNNYSERFGLELTFAQQLQKQYPERSIAIIKYSVGGTSIAEEAARQFGCWEADFVGKTGINQYDHFLASVKQAMAIRDIDGDGKADRLIPAGILWMQGESDGAITENIAQQYFANLKRLMDLCRAAFLSDDLPVIIGKISDSGNDTDGIVWDYGELIRYAQEKYVRTDANAAIVRSTDDYGYSDRWHYDSAGYIDLGKRFAEALLELE